MQPISFVQVATPRVSTEQASQRTVHRRVTAFLDMRGALSVDLADGGEVNALPKDRSTRCSCLKLVYHLRLQLHALAMKANLSISWNKLRTVRR